MEDLSDKESRLSLLPPNRFINNTRLLGISCPYFFSLSYDDENPLAAQSERHLFSSDSA